MKFLIVLACTFAIAYANYDTKVIKSEQEVNPDSFKYTLELDNGLELHQEGHLEANKNWKIKGDFAFVTKKGEQVDLAYTADENGFHPDPSNEWIHPIPKHILRAIEYTKTHPSYEEEEKKKSV